MPDPGLPIELEDLAVGTILAGHTSNPSYWTHPSDLSSACEKQSITYIDTNPSSTQVISQAAFGGQACKFITCLSPAARRNVSHGVSIRSYRCTSAQVQVPTGSASGSEIGRSRCLVVPLSPNTMNNCLVSCSLKYHWFFFAKAVQQEEIKERHLS